MQDHPYEHLGYDHYLDHTTPQGGMSWPHGMHYSHRRIQYHLVDTEERGEGLGTEMMMWLGLLMLLVAANLAGG